MAVVKDNPRQLAVEILVKVFKNQSYADILLEKRLADSRMPPNDKALLTEIVYGSIRWKRRLEFLAQRQYRGKWAKMPETVQWALLTALYQIVYLDKVPNYAVVSQAVSLAKTGVGNKHWGSVVNGILRTLLANESALMLPSSGGDKIDRLALKWSHPSWLVKRWVDLWGFDKAEALCRANNRRPHFSLRVNPLRISSHDFSAWLLSQDAEAQQSKYLSNMWVVKKLGSLTQSDAFKRGHFSIQDESAALVSRLFDLRPGDAILDVAAAPGGKCFHMAERIHDSADIYACDRHFNRLKLLVKAGNRLGFSRIFPILTDGSRPAFKQQFDKVLLDAPCTGLGVLRRRTELRWFRTEEELVRISEVQKRLLNESAALVKAGGQLIYSTCSIQPEENEAIIQDFLEKNTEFELGNLKGIIDIGFITEEGMMRTWPDLHGLDGAFAALLVRKK